MRLKSTTESVRYEAPRLKTVVCRCERGFQVSLDGVTEEDGKWE